MRYNEQQLAQLNANPLYGAMGIRIVAMADGAGESIMQPQPAMCWPTEGRPHGGVLFTLLDTTLAFAATTIGEATTGCATVDASIQYTAPADHPPFRCKAGTLSSTSRTAFLRGEVTDAHGRIVALAQATFRLFNR